MSNGKQQIRFVHIMATFFSFAGGNKTGNSVMIAPMRTMFIAALTALVLSAGQVYANESKFPYIEVTGRGAATGQPDMAILSLTVLRSAKTAREALDANNEAMNSVLTEMKSAGVQPKDLQSSGFSIQPRYVYPKPRKDGHRPAPVLTGYAVSNQLSVRIRDITSTGSILDKAVSLGVNKVGNIRLMVENPAPLREQARSAAMREAIQKAQILTQAGGIQTGIILSIREQNLAAPRPQMMRAQSLSMAAESSVPLATGEVSYSVNVTVRWALKQ
jgi:uncharacterized protein